MSRQNIVFFFTDQQRFDSVGCYNNQINITPNLDKIAKEGTRYEYAFTCQPVCGPARACIQTGQYATKNTCFMNGIPLPTDAITLPKLFEQNGYSTAYIGKWHLSNTFKDAVPKELRGGWNQYWLASDALEYTSSAYGGYMYDEDNKKVSFDNLRIDAVTDYAIDYIKNYNESKPFFLFISHLEPHHQNDQKRYIAPYGYADKYKNEYIPQDLLNNPEKGDWEENLSEYYGCIKRLDEKFGELIETLKSKGIYDDTTIIFTTDHGSHFRTRNNEYKRSCHEASLRIPLVIKGEKFKKDSVYKNLVSLIDVPETLLDIADIEIPNTMQGTSLLKKGITNEIFAQISETQVGRCIRTEKYKLSIVAKDKDGCKDSFSDIYTPEFLYDLEKDPFELKNLVNLPEYKDIQENLISTLVLKMVSIGETKPSII